MSMIEKIPTEFSKKSRSNDSADKEIKLFIDKVKLEMNGYCKLMLEKIYFNKQVQSEDIIFKVSTIVGALNRKLKPKICEHRNESMMVN